MTVSLPLDLEARFRSPGYPEVAERILIAAEALGIGYCSTPQDVAANADIVSLHVAANAETEKLVDAAFLGAMRDGAYLVTSVAILIT